MTIDSIDEYLFALLNNDVSFHKISKEILQYKYDDMFTEIIILYVQFKKFYEFSVKYSQDRNINGKPIAFLATVREKLDYANSILNVYQCSLVCKAGYKDFAIFIKVIVFDTLEELLHIHGAAGYMKKNYASELWLDCVHKIKNIIIKVNLL
jgi:hypothetical protein